MIDRNTKAGMALIIILWVVTILGTITMLFSRRATLSLKISKNVNESISAELIAEGGIYRMMAELKEDEQQSTSDSKNEMWYDNQTSNYDVPLGKGVYRLINPDPSDENITHYGAGDECSKLNINTATREMLMRLPGATDEIVDCILDWRDTDMDPRDFGAEDEYYQSLPEPIYTKNGLFDSLEELLLVKNMSINLLYGEDINVNGVLDPNENDGDESYPIDNGDGKLDRGWYPFLTCFSYEKNVDGTGNTRININSASRDQFKQQFGDSLTDTEIDSIISARDSNKFQSIGDLLGGGGGGGNRNAAVQLDREKFKKIADKITISDETKLQGRININTAPVEVLRFLLGEENETVVQAIVQQRESEKGAYADIGQLLDVQGLDDAMYKQVVNLISTKTSVFSIRSAGYVMQSKTYKEIYTILDRGETPPQIRYWKVVR